MTPLPRRRRSLEDMVDALSRHVRLLDAYVEKAKTDSDYLGEIAGKLRLLIVEMPNPRHRPLLLRVAEAYDARLTITPREGTDRKTSTWPEFLQTIAFTTQGGDSITFGRFIRMWAEQIGGPHEDEELAAELVEVLQFPARVGGTGLPLSHHNLLTIAGNVSASARSLLRNIESLKRIKELAGINRKRNSGGPH